MFQDHYRFKINVTQSQNTNPSEHFSNCQGHKHTIITNFSITLSKATGQSALSTDPHQ